MNCIPIVFFYSIPIGLLKVLKHGIQGKTFDIIKNMYNETKSCVTVNGCSSTFFKCQQGVRQGEKLSPLLFSIYLNDLDNFMHTSGCKGIEINIQDQEFILSYDVASGSEITPCNKICKPLVVYRFTGNVMTSITTLRT